MVTGLEACAADIASVLFVVVTARATRHRARAAHSSWCAAAHLRPVPPSTAPLYAVVLAGLARAYHAHRCDGAVRQPRPACSRTRAAQQSRAPSTGALTPRQQPASGPGLTGQIGCDASLIPSRSGVSSLCGSVYSSRSGLHGARLDISNRFGRNLARKTRGPRCCRAALTRPHRSDGPGGTVRAARTCRLEWCGAAAAPRAARTSWGARRRLLEGSARRRQNGGVPEVGVRHLLNSSTVPGDRRRRSYGSG